MRKPTPKDVCWMTCWRLEHQIGAGRESSEMCLEELGTYSLPLCSVILWFFLFKNSHHSVTLAKYKAHCKSSILLVPGFFSGFVAQLSNNIQNMQISLQPSLGTGREWWKHAFLGCFVQDFILTVPTLMTGAPLTSRSGESSVCKQQRSGPPLPCLDWFHYLHSVPFTFECRHYLLHF